MTEDTGAGESFAAFKDSFSYGSRTDLTFKFLKRLSPEDAARFLQELFGRLGDTCDDGRAERLVDHVCEWQRRAYAETEGPGGSSWTYADGPFTPLKTPWRPPAWCCWRPVGTSSTATIRGPSASRT